MKNLILLGVAIVAGLAAFAANFEYLKRQTAQEQVKYLAASASIGVGDVFSEKNLKGFDLPSDVEVAAVRYADASAILNRKSLRKYAEGELVLLQDVSGPRASLYLESGEKGLSLDVSAFLLEPSLVRVGDKLSFVASSPNDVDEMDDTDGIRMLGNFRVVAIGDLVFQGSGVANASEYRARISTITVAINMDGDEPDKTAKDLIRASDSSGILRVLLSPRESE